jgi:hypothetical protein
MNEQELRKEILRLIKEAFRLSHSAYKNGRKPIIGSSLIIIRRHLRPCIKELEQYDMEAVLSEDVK